MQIIPAIDLRAGRCVRLLQGDYRQETVFSDDPLAVAQSFARQGARRLHMVDLDGARAGRPLHLEQLSRIADLGLAEIQFGGGLRTTESVKQALAAGASRVILGTAAIRQPGWLADLAAAFPGQVLVSLDTRGGRLTTAGWLEEEQQDALSLASSLADLGISEVIHTSVERDGTMAGPDLVGLDRLLASGLPVIAAGGIGSLGDIAALASRAAHGISAVIVGRALYEQRFSLQDAIRLAEEEQYAG